MADSWRLLDSGPCAAAHNMALDESIATAVREDDAPPTLRFYGWHMPSLSIGYFQKITSVDVEYCALNNIPLVRRLTGGRAVLHGKEVTYSFSSKTTSGLFSGGLLDSYRKISGALGLALSSMGASPEVKLARSAHGPSRCDSRSKSPACFQSVSYGEITVKSAKVIGSAQKRWTDALLQQGSILLVSDKDHAERVFRLDTSREITNLHHMGLRDVLPGFTYESLKEAIVRSFEETFNVRFSDSSLSVSEISMARKLETDKYSSREWTFRR